MRLWVVRASKVPAYDRTTLLGSDLNGDCTLQPAMSTLPIATSCQAATSSASTAHQQPAQVISAELLLLVLR